MAGTIQQIAQLAGVSRGTVDRVLNRRGRVKPEVAENVERIAAELGYVPKHQRPGDANRRLRVGIVTQLSRSSFMIPVNRGIADIRERLGLQGIATTLVESAAVDEAEQLSALEALEAEGIQALAIMPAECEGVRQRLNALIRRGIPVVTFNTDIVGTDRQCFVGLDNRQSGRAAAGLMGLMLENRGKVLGITGYFSNSAGSRRMDGFIEELKARFPEMELVGVQSSFDRGEEVEKIVRGALRSFPDLRGVFLASGGQEGLRGAFEGLALRPRVIFYDMTEKNARLLQEDLADFLIDQEGYSQGYQAVSIAAQLAMGEEGPEEEYLYTAINLKTRYNL